MLINKALLSAVVPLAAAAATEELSAAELAPHIAREIVDKTPVLHVSTVDRDENVPVAHIERHISSDSCKGVNFANNGNPILLLSRLNATSANCQKDGEHVSITIEHPPFHGQDIFDRPSINLYGSVNEMSLSEDEVNTLTECFKRQNRAPTEWLEDPETFFAEFNVDKVNFNGDFGYGEFNGMITGDDFHGASEPHQPPPCPFHRPPPPKEGEDDGNHENKPNNDGKKNHHKGDKKHHDGDKKHHDGKKKHHDGKKKHHDGKKEGEEKKEHHGKKHADNNEYEEHVENEEKKQHHGKDGKKHDGKKHDGKKHDGKKHDGKKHDGKKHDGKKEHAKEHSNRHQENDEEVDIPTIFEVLRIWFNNY